jgi:hypothetical protein
MMVTLSRLVECLRILLEHQVPEQLQVGHDLDVM